MQVDFLVLSVVDPVDTKQGPHARTVFNTFWMQLYIYNNCKHVSTFTTELKSNQKVSIHKN